MNKRKLIIIGVSAVVLSILICVVVFVRNTKSMNIDDDIFDIVDRVGLEKYISNSDIESYNFDKQNAYIRNVNLFNRSANIEFIMTENVVDEISVYYEIFPVGVHEEYKSVTEVPEDVPVYQFTEKDKANIKKSFQEIKSSFEKYIGCTFEDYDIVPIEDFENIENNEENFFDGKFLKEYSVRDRSGILWIMRYEASYGSSSVVIRKFINESNFDGFIPRIDLTKK